MGSIGPQQLATWFDAYAAQLVLYVRQWLDVGLAEDVVQDVFVRLAAIRSEPANAKAWLFRSVRNEAISKIRSRRRRQNHEARRAANQPTWFEPRPDELVDAATAQSAVESLPAEQREVVILRLWTGMTFQEISEIVSRPVSTVADRYHSALAAIRRTMEKCHEK
jgi:RNA polymerase sigma-70 factor (ECF subfamily)